MSTAPVWSMTVALAVAAGGAAGSVLRYLVGVWVPRPTPGDFPVATLAINVVGSLLLAWLALLAAARAAGRALGGGLRVHAGRRHAHRRLP